MPQAYWLTLIYSESHCPDTDMHTHRTRWTVYSTLATKNISCRRWTRTTSCFSCIMACYIQRWTRTVINYTTKLVSVTSTVASIAN